VAVILSFRKRRHVRASVASRAANAASNSAVKPARRAVSVLKIASHHSGGMLSRCGHLRAAAMPTPISAAKASGVCQSATTSRKLLTMQPVLGQHVPTIKPMVSRDCEKAPGQNVLMRDQSEKQWKADFCARLRQARGRRTRKDMADLLGVSLAAYAKWEDRGSEPPLWLLPKIWKIGEMTPEFLLAGEESPQKPAKTRDRKKKSAA